MQSSAAKTATWRPRIANAAQVLVRTYFFPAQFFANQISKRLPKRWGQTYTMIGLTSTAFLILATFGIQPELRLPAWMVAILTPIILSEYVSFLTRVHKKTLEIYGGSPCKTRLAILRVTKTRPLTFLALVATSFILAGVGFLNVSYPLLAGFPYYAALNISYLTRFRIPGDSELQTAFDALEELSSLSKFYQAMALRIIADRVEKVVRKSVPLAKNVVAHPLLRSLYVGYSIPVKTATMKDEVSKLKEALAKETQDVFASIDKVSGLIPGMYGNANLTFQLPWESKVNWGLVFAFVFGLIDATGTLFILQNSGFFLAAFKIIFGR